MGSRKLHPRSGTHVLPNASAGASVRPAPFGAAADSAHSNRSALSASTRVQGLVIGGVDPGTRQVGYAILRAENGHWRVLACGSIACGRGAMAERLGRISAELEALFAEHHPARVGIESTYYGKSAGAAIKMGQGRGVAMAAAARANATVVELAPRSIKQAVTGNGGASKDQVAAMAVSLLGLSRRPRSADASDALGCALAVAMLSEGIPLGRALPSVPAGSARPAQKSPGVPATPRRPGRKLR